MVVPMRRLIAITWHLTGMGVLSAVCGALVAGLVIPFAAVVGRTADSTAQYVSDLPRELVLKPLPQRSTILDHEGHKIADVFDQNRTEVPLSRVSPLLTKAVIAIEDARFYQHGAMDLEGTARALITNQASGGVVQGGSSITQQMVKQTLVTQARTKAERHAATEETFARKLRELRYAIGAERQLSKRQILERYLNLAYFGNGAYGIQAAARRYFSVDAADLSLAQAAMLAGLVKNPVGYDPFDRAERATNRRNTVLGRMAQLKVVPRAQAERASRSELGLRPETLSNGCTASPAPFFCDYVLNYLARDPALGDTPEARLQRVRTGGLTIRTTVDLSHQRAADASVQRHTDPTDQAIGALALLEPGTGRVRALAQSRPMGADRAAGQTYLNYTVPHEYGGSAGFQAGSTFKLFVLAAAIERGIPLDRVFRTPNTLTVPLSSYRNCAGSGSFGSDTFTVRNSQVKSSGRENLYSGTRHSINTFFLKLERVTGVCAPFRLAQEMGVRLDAPDGDESTQPERVPIFPLGVANASPLEMAEAYATFAARGRHCDAQPVTEISTATEVVKRYEPSCSQVLQTSTADAVNDVLRGIIEPGGSANAQALDQPAAGKTGNNQGLSVWFVGYINQLSGAAMIAGANQQGTPLSLEGTVVGGRQIDGLSASAYAAPIWGDAMKQLDGSYSDTDFVSPRGVPGTGVTEPAPVKKPTKGRRRG